jgi:hypothetical protein
MRGGESIAGRSQLLDLRQFLGVFALLLFDLRRAGFEFRLDTPPVVAPLLWLLKQLGENRLHLLEQRREEATRLLASEAKFFERLGYGAPAVDFRGQISGHGFERWLLGHW